MTYCFLNYVPAKDGHGFEPDCPDGTGFLLLADLPGLDWGIFDVNEDDAWSPENPVGDELTTLIESAKRYPPAMGIGREEVCQVFGEDLPTRSEFARAYGAALRTHLSRQHESPYVLAPALKDEATDLTKGEWYWVLKISGNPPVVSWVSDDFQICQNDVSDFDLTGQQMKHLGFSG